MFYVGDVTFGHFSLRSQPTQELSSFSQGQLNSGQVQFVQDGSLSAPGYSTAVAADGLQSASQPAGIFFTPIDDSGPLGSNSGDSEYSTVEKAIIGAVVSGTIGIFFAMLQGCLKRSANKKLLQTLGEGTDEYDLTVVRPVAQEIAGRIKITGFLNATTNTRIRSFKSAVRSLLSALSEKGVNLNFTEMKPVERDALINEIGNQTYRWMKSKRHGCTACCPGLSAFFRPEIVPENLQDATDEIANNVVSALQERNKSQQSLSAGLLTSGSPIYKDPKNSMPSVELLEIDSPSLRKSGQEELRNNSLAALT